jgi:hypothetical protein
MIIRGRKIAHRLISETLGYYRKKKSYVRNRREKIKKLHDWEHLQLDNADVGIKESVEAVAETYKQNKKLVYLSFKQSK